MASFFDYLPDRQVLDEQVAFTELAAPFFCPGDETGCLVLHGIGGTPANVRVVADALSAAGHTVYAPLLPGHGKTVRALNASTGEEWLACVRTGYDRLKEAGCVRILLFGLSLGGVLCGLLATEREAAGLCLISAPVVMKPYLQLARLVSPVLSFVRYPDSAGRTYDWRKDPYAQMYNGFSTKKLRDLNRLRKRLIREMGRIRCPILILEAALDDKVDAKTVPVIRSRCVSAPSVEQVTLKNSPHGSTYGPEREKVAALCADFAANILGK